MRSNLGPRLVILGMDTATAALGFVLAASGCASPVVWMPMVGGGILALS